MSASNGGVFVSLLIIVLIGKEVSSWTVELPEATKYSKNNDENNVISKKETEIQSIREDSPQYTQEGKKYVTYDNKIRDFKNDVNYNAKYADNYEYQSYKEKKVHDIVHSGSAYLDGLSHAMDRYGALLRICSERFNITESTNTSWTPQNKQPLYLAEASLDIQPSLSVCERAVASREQVRRLAALALWASRELEDKMFADEGSGERSSDREEEEKELLLRLAWFLDRLAQLTGFQPPNHRAAHSSATDIISSFPSKSTSDTLGSSSEPAELLQHSETRKSAIKSVKKRSLDSPLVTIVNYYIKHKVWDGSNPTSESHARSEDFNVKNDITYVNNDLTAVKRVQRRSIDYKTNLNEAETNYVKYKKEGLNFGKNGKQSQEIKGYSAKLLHHTKKPSATLL